MYDNLANENLEAIKLGISNLIHHIKVLKNVYNVPVVVTLNKFVTDTDAEIELVKELLPEEDVVVNEVWAKGGNGASLLYQKVKGKCNQENGELKYAYNLTDSVETKIEDIVNKVYGGASVTYTEKAKKAINTINDYGYNDLPVIMAKTQSSLSADKKLLGAPTGFNVEIKDIEIRSGAGFLVVICGDMLLMPGLGKVPASDNMTIDNEGIITGLF